jgi:hypothetical protein
MQSSSVLVLHVISSKPKPLFCGTDRIFGDAELGRRTKQFNSKRDDERVRCVAGRRNQTLFTFNDFC